MHIVQMPQSLSNKIAAGEVVERPASVVKELVENSIDANSTWIKIELEEAGLQTIRLTDNGNGMSEADAERAFLRHATSKIQDEHDLFNVNSLGFRGEALASIAAVSRMMLKTSEGNEAGTVLTMEGGRLIGKTKSDARQGTEMLVEDLFFNTPARLKYMKTFHTELGNITELLNRFALSHPHIRFEVYHDHKQLFKTSGSNQLLQAISNVYGMKVARQMMPIQTESLDFTMNGYISRPELTRSTRNYITILINGRYIKNYRLAQAIANGYHTMLPKGRHPIVVLNIQMDPTLVDVNVHPAKMQVRFSKEKALETLVETTIKQELQGSNLIPHMQTNDQDTDQSQTFEQPQMIFETQSQVQAEPSDFLQSNETQTTIPEDYSEPGQYGAQALSSIIAPSSPSIDEEPVDSGPSQTNTAVSQSNTTHESVPVMYPIGQLHGTYILAQNDTGFYMIDQHAAQERIKYEFFKSQLGHPDKALQDMLIPLTFDVTKQEAIYMEQNRQALESIGLYFESFGPQSYVIRSHPTWFPKGEEESIIRDVVEQITHQETIDIETLREETAIMMSCKRSIKANHHLNQDEMFGLLENLRQSENPYTCPHGRPVIVHFSSYELEKMFKRVM